MRSLGAIADLSVPHEERVVSIDERALRYRQEYRRVDDNRPMTAAPIVGTVAAPAANADTITDAVPPLPRSRHRRSWCQMPSLPRHCLALVFNAVERCHRRHRRH